MNDSLPPAITLRLPKGVELEFRLIPAGEFRMGARGESSWEEPVHRVTITQPYYLGRYPVTQEQYAAFRPDHKNGFPGDLRRPAEQVSWNDTMDFCAWLNDRSRVAWPSGLNRFAAQLPTEAQWEYACRAGTESEYHTGDGEIALAAAGWYGDNSENRTHPVGWKEPNTWGLCDMHGNVWEWCSDAFDADAYKVRVDGGCDSEVTERDVNENVLRVFRGGSWYFSARFCRAACRNGFKPGDRGRNLGFRVCLLPGPCHADSSVSDSAHPVPADEERHQAAAQSESTGLAAGARAATSSPQPPSSRDRAVLDP